jgi:hypothetical protein
VLSRKLPFLLLLLLSACRGEPVALAVGEIEFTSAEVAELSPAQVDALADLAAFGQVVARGELEALVDPLRAHALHRSHLRSLPYHLGAGRMGLSDDDIRTAYLRSPEWELTVRHLVRLAPLRSSPAQRAEARAVAEQAAARAAAGEDLAELAAELSEEPGAERTGGLLRPGRRGSWVTPFWEAAAALQVGEVSGVVESEYGYHVLRVEQRQPVSPEEVSRPALLGRVVPPEIAAAAMEEWAATRPPVEVAREGVILTLEALRDGCIPPEVDLLRNGGLEPYTSVALAVSWMTTPSERRERLLASPESFLAWAEDDAREAVWAGEARRAGAEPAEGDAAAGEIVTRLQSAGGALGFARHATPETIRARVLAAVSARGQEERIAREAIAGVRPLLRQRYPAAGPAGSCLEGSSSSEILNSENTR